MTEERSVGIVTPQYHTFAEPPHEMLLESGARLGPITLCYETYGTLNALKNNAILITHALSGDAHVAGRHSDDDRKPGWWDSMVGPGKAFDTDRYFVVCSNVLGGCRGSTGPAETNPATGKPYGLDFPIITIGDMVRAQHELITHLGITQLLCVAGGSMGGMQALEWATAFPDAVRSAMVIASTSLSGAQQIAFDAVGRNAILADKHFRGGQYYGTDSPDRGLAIARMLAHITYLSDQSMQAKFGRSLRSSEKLQYEFDSEFAVETYLDYQGAQFVNRFDANTYLYVTKAMDYFDIAAQYGSLDNAVSQIKAKMLVLAYSSDWLYPSYLSERIAYALARQNKDVTYCNVTSDYGHDAFLLEVEVMDQIISGFLTHTYAPIAPEPVLPQLTLGKGSNSNDDQSIYSSRRVDYDTIEELVEDGAKVLDIGCGDGELLSRLVSRKNIVATGLEKAQENVVACTQRGISVIQADIDDGLNAFPDQSFDYIILSMTLQVIKNPELAVREMLRVGRKCIVSFPNFAHWRIRAQLLFHGRAPVTRNLPYSWNQTPNRHVLSLRDFQEFCEKLGIKIEKEVPLYSTGAIHFLPNLLAEEALYVISRNGENS